MKHKVVLIIRDGMGIAPAGPYNAVSNARTPVNDSLLASCPHTILDPSGESVGLPAGYQGSSEVGHLNMGAGRIVKQEITRINETLEQGTFFEAENFRRVVDNCLKHKSAIHLMGLVQDEGVHAHEDHLHAIMAHVVAKGITDVNVHFFADGRDTPPRSAMTYVKRLRQKIEQLGAGRIATVMGRYYAMDRGRKWELTDQAYATLVQGAGKPYLSIEDAINDSYASLKSPDGSDMTDEYIPPCVLGGFEGIREHDSVVHFNFRQDRAIQLTMAFVDDNYPGRRSVRPEIVYCGLTKYYDSFSFNVLGAMSSGGGMENILGEVLSNKGLRQIRISETQKFNHVTSFMNGKRIEPFSGEERIEIKSSLDPSSFADHPQMSAYEVAAAAQKAILCDEFDFVAVNFANCDMVGHTGNFASAVRAVEVVDECVGLLVDAARKTGAVCLITADHGNAEEMYDESLHEPKTAHTVNPVHLIYAGADSDSVKLIDRGILSDIAPTVLSLLQVDIPTEMTARSLIVS